MARRVSPWLRCAPLVFSVGTAGACSDGEVANPVPPRVVAAPPTPFLPYVLECPGAPAGPTSAPAQTLLELLASDRDNPCALVSDYGPLVAESVGFYATSGRTPPSAIAVPFLPTTQVPDALPVGRYLIAESARNVLDGHRTAVRQSVGPAVVPATPAHPLDWSTVRPEAPDAPNFTPGTMMLPDAPHALRRFSYVYGDPALQTGAPFSLAGMSGRDLLTSRLEDTLRLLRLEGTSLVVSLTETAPRSDAFEAYGIGHAHLPVRDFTAPELVQIEDFIALVESERPRGRVVVHCGAGLGRTGTFLAAFFVHAGQTAEQAIATVRTLRPGSIETAAQEAMVATYAAHLGGG